MSYYNYSGCGIAASTSTIATVVSQVHCTIVHCGIAALVLCYDIASTNFVFMFFFLNGLFLGAELHHEGRLNLSGIPICQAA